MSAARTSAQRLFDCDVHCALPGIEALLPYVSDHWRGYLRENGFKAPQALQFTFPSWSRPFATTAQRTTLEQLRSNVLAHAEEAVLNCYFGVESQRNPFFAAALASAINDWMRDSFLEPEPRLWGSIVIAPHDTAEAVAEIERLGGDDRFVQVLLPARAWEPYGNRRYWPIWEAAERHGLALAIHLGGLAGWSGTPVGDVESYFEEYGVGTQLLQGHVVSLVCEGVFNKYPGLRVCLLESGVSWLPAFLWKFDTDWKGHRREVPWLQEEPSAYVRRHVRATIQPFDTPPGDRATEQIVAQLQTDEMLLYASDYPHDNGCDPRELLALLGEEQAERVRWSNAWSCFGMERRTRSGSGAAQHA